MDSSRRAVESYWLSRMIDAVTSDEDKIAPVYKLEEICQLLGSSHVSIVKEMSDFVLKRLYHRSPIVKQKVHQKLGPSKSITLCEEICGIGASTPEGISASSKWASNRAYSSTSTKLSRNRSA